jgi:lysophospholipase L1-like esterase
MNWIKILIKLFIFATITIAFLIFIELSVRYFYDNDNSADEWYKSIPKAFWGEENYSLVIKALDGTCKWPPMLHSNNVTTYSKNFSCGGVTYVNKKRLTLPVIKEWEKTIHVFGGSTTLGTGAVDKDTIPSLIQKNVINSQTRVLNYGFPSYVSNQQNSLLVSSKSDIKKDDIVIYYDGGNDFWNSVMLGNYNGSMIGYNQTNKYQVYIFTLRVWLSQNSSTYQLLSNIKHGRNKKSNQCSTDYQTGLMRINKAANLYSYEVSKAKSIVENLGASFYHFYQPTLFDSVILSTYEKKIFSQNPCWVIAGALKNDFDNELLDISKDSIDLSNVLVGTDLFFDYIHTSSEGNKIISKAIVSNIKK